MTIYLDLLLCFNLFIHFCLLSSTAAFCRVRVGVGRMLGGCILGSLGSFVIFLSLPPLALAGIKTVLALLLTLVTFGFHSASVFVRRLLAFLAVNFLYAGGMYAVNEQLRPAGLVYQNGVAYFAADTGGYLIGVLFCYLLLRFAALMLQKNAVGKRVTVRLRLGEDAVDCVGFCDSGNKACDFATGKPILILSPQVADKLFPNGLPQTADEMKTFGHRIRLMPFETVGGSGLLPVFTPDELIVDGCSRDFAVAVGKTELADGIGALLPAAAEL